MRLDTITLHRYGNYEAERIRFNSAPGVVNVLLAPNSAGKSVLRNAFADLLFGIGRQTPMGFRFGYPGMRVAADIVRRDGSTISFSRRKTRGNALTDADDQILDQTFLHGILGGRDRDLLERLFVLDTEALRAGGKALLDSGGDVASALLSAAGGIRQARALRKRLEQQRDDLAPVRKVAGRPFYQALEAFTNARTRIRTSAIRPDEWFQQERSLRDLEEQRQLQNRAAEDASAEIALLERVRRVRPSLAKHSEAAVWLTENPDAPRVPARLREDLNACRMDVAIKEQTAARSRDDLTAAECRASEVIVDAEVLARGEDIERLVQEAGAARKARDDLPGVSGQYQHGLARLESLLRQLGSALPSNRAIDAVPKAAPVGRARALMRAHAELTAGIRRSDEQIEGRMRDLAEAERLLADVPPAADVLPLESLMASIRADGDPAAHLSSAEGASRDADADLRGALGQVPGWSGDAAALIAIAPLTVDIYGRHDKDIAAARNDVVTARERLDDENNSLERVRTELDAISRQGNVPDEAALTSARARRDGLWRLILRRGFAGPAAETGEPPLPLDFERAVAEADQIADRRFADAELVARMSTARQVVADAERRALAAGERLRVAVEKHDQLRRVWAQICGPLPLGEYPAIEDILAFRKARERVIEAARRRDMMGGTLSTLMRRHAEWARELSSLLGHHTNDLPALLALGDRTLAEARRQQAERLKLETKGAQATTELNHARAARAGQQEKQDLWRTAWRTALADLGRPGEEEPVATEAVLEIMREIEKEYGINVSLSERISGMQIDIERFSRSVRDLARSLPTLSLSEEPPEAVRELDRALKQERAQQQRQDILRKSLEATRDTAAAADQAFNAAQTRLRAILSMVGADTIEAAEQHLARSAERDRHEARIDEAAAELQASGDGFSVEVLRAESELIPAGELASRVDAAAAARTAASEAAQRIAVEASALRHRMDRDQDETGIAQASADQQAAIATLSRTLDEAMVYHTASAILGRALEAVEKSGDSKLLQHLTVIFQTLTDGAYLRVVSEMNDDGKADFALVQRDFPEERQTIAQLSEGTRDQFFLALRVAAIEDHLTSAEPLPFVGDDILQTFDDDRSLAALRVLTELSAHTQVIVLTHHRHVLDLAARLPAGTIFACQRESAQMAI